MSYEKSTPPPDRQLPAIDNRLPFPASDISKTSPNYIHALNQLQKIEAEQSNWSKSVLLHNLVNREEWQWRRTITESQQDTYDAVLELARQWDQDNVPKRKTPAYVQWGFRSAHTLSLVSGLLPTDYRMQSEDIAELKDTFMGDETKQTNRTLLFGAAALTSMQTHPNIATLYMRLKDVIVSSEGMSKYQGNLINAGIGLQYILSAHTRIAEPLDSITGLRIPCDEKLFPYSDREAFFIGGKYAAERQDYQQ